MNYTRAGPGLSEVGTDDCEHSQVEQEIRKRDVVLQFRILGLLELVWSGLVVWCGVVLSLTSTSVHL